MSGSCSSADLDHHCSIVPFWNQDILASQFTTSSGTHGTLRRQTSLQFYLSLFLDWCLSQAGSWDLTEGDLPWTLSVVSDPECLFLTSTGDLDVYGQQADVLGLEGNVQNHLLKSLFEVNTTEESLNQFLSSVTRTCPGSTWGTAVGEPNLFLRRRTILIQVRMDGLKFHTGKIWIDPGHCRVYVEALGLCFLM